MLQRLSPCMHRTSLLGKGRLLCIWEDVHSCAISEDTCTAKVEWLMQMR